MTILVEQMCSPYLSCQKQVFWYKVFDALIDLFLKKQPKSTKIQSHFTQIKTHIDLDAQTLRESLSKNTAICLEFVSGKFAKFLYKKST